MVGLVLMAAVVLGGFLLAWHHWLPLLRYRENRLRAAYHEEIRRYLQGSQSLDVTAHRLAGILVKRWVLIRNEVPAYVADEGSMTITVEDMPPDIPSHDPRVEELVLNAFKLVDPPEVSEAFRVRSAQMWDSMIHAKGYRSVP